MQVVIHLDYDGDTYVALVLWDSYVGFAKLFEQVSTRWGGEEWIISFGKSKVKCNLLNFQMARLFQV